MDTPSALSSCSIRELKELIARAGLSCVDCLDRADLLARAKEAEQLHATKSPETSVPPSGAAESNEPSTAQQATSAPTAERVESATPVDRIIRSKGDPYAILGVSKMATGAEVKKAFRNACLVVHPDKCGHPQATIAFQLVNEAHAILCDPAKRDAHNLRAAQQAAAQHSAAQHAAAQQAAAQRAQQAWAQRAAAEAQWGPELLPMRAEILRCTCDKIRAFLRAARLALYGVKEELASRLATHLLTRASGNTGQAVQLLRSLMSDAGLTAFAAATDASQAQARAHAQAQARAHAEAMAREHAEKLRAQMEAQLRAKAEMERRAQVEAERRAQVEAERRAQVEAERRAQVEAQRRAYAEAVEARKRQMASEQQARARHQEELRAQEEIRRHVQAARAAAGGAAATSSRASHPDCQADDAATPQSAGPVPPHRQETKEGKRGRPPKRARAPAAPRARAISLYTPARVRPCFRRHVCPRLASCSQGRLGALWTTARSKRSSPTSLSARPSQLPRRRRRPQRNRRAA
jgi:curved DNA-binding protein CbpA